jgi:RNA polymerase sigma factor for flagellar operon FliA
MAFSHAAVYEAEQETAEARRERLILEHLPQVRYHASRIHEVFHGAVSLDDLMSSGVIGLIAAIDHFDASYNVKLSTYADFRIRGAIMDSIRNRNGIGRTNRPQVRRIQSAIDRLEQRLLRVPTEEEIGAELGLSLEQYRTLLQENRAVRICSLDAAPANTEDITFEFFLADRSGDQPEERLEREQLHKILADGVRRMPLIERQVLSLYYVEQLTLREIGEVMKLHGSRISQLKTQAILRLRAWLDQKCPGLRSGGQR